MYISNTLRKHIGHITLLLLILLAGLKFYLGGCRLWICMAFVGIVVTYMIISDMYGNKNKPDAPPEER
jgi:hypothetical protein